VTDLLPQLQEFYEAKLGVLLRHQAGARLIRQYDINNAYQYLINRDDAHLSWVAAAIVDLGGLANDSAPEPVRRAGRDAAVTARMVLEEDSRDAQEFVDRWRPRVDAMTNARHRGMLSVILGEMLEQKRSFEQGLAGQLDLLGRRPDHVGPRVGEVLPTRWVE